MLRVTAAGFFPHYSLPQNVARSEELLLKPSGLEGHEHHAVHAQLKQTRACPKQPVTETQRRRGSKAAARSEAAVPAGCGLFRRTGIRG